ncbi:TPA: hypothetical protein N0F65_006477, partial [Lagenidium giganteum]
FYGCGQKSTFRVLGLQQVAIGGLNKSALSNLWVDTFGLKKKGTFRSEKENVDEDILAIGRGPFAVEVDIMQPINPDKAPKGMRFTPGGIRKGAAGFDVAFIHPKGNDATPLSGEGVLIELVQAPQSVIDAFDKLKDE